MQPGCEEAHEDRACMAESALRKVGTSFSREARQMLTAITFFAFKQLRSNAA